MFKVQIGNKKMNKNTRKQRHILHKLAAMFILLIGAVATVGMSTVPRVATADSISDQINALEQQNATNQNAVAQLQNEASSYQDAINRLQSQINLLQGQIDNNAAKQADLQNKIQANQDELTRQRSVLADNIHVMYVEGQTSTIEMLATSKSLSDFVDKEEYRTTIQNKIQDTLKRINDIQNTLKTQKTQIDALVTEEQSQRAQLDGSRAQQASMLAYNQSQQATYNASTRNNQAKIDSLIAQQRRANDSITSGYYFIRFPGAIASHDYNVNDYPYANGGFGMSTAPGCVDNDGPDRWGYCDRQCVSYAAWAVERSGRTAPRFYGNAKEWVSAARSDGIPVYTSNPQPGDIAISTAGTWGHAMYVEKVSGNQIFVSQYNQQLTGAYSTQWRTWE